MIEGGIIEDELDIDTLIHSGSRWYFIIRLSTIEKVKTDSSDGYFMGGNSLTGFTVASTIIMTNLSTEQIGTEWTKLFTRYGSYGMGGYCSCSGCTISLGLLT